jgi:Orsellinic acid/F9775 biosynthesis cluster protein D
VATTAPKDLKSPDEYNVIRIPYGHPNIITSPNLNLLNCIFYKPLRILICIVCEIGVAPGYLRVHRGRYHGDSSSISDVLESLVRDLDIRREDRIKDHAENWRVIPGIPYCPGFQCSFPSCSLARKSITTMRRHVTSDHNSSIKEYPATSY